MKIVVNHLTRMQKGYVCAAGVDLETGRNVRPVLPNAERLSSKSLACEGGVFDMAMEVDLGTVKPVPQAPELEDHIFYPANSILKRKWKAEEFWQLLNRIAKPRLKDIFGQDLCKIGRDSCGVERGRGQASLGCLILKDTPSIDINQRQGKPDQVRMKISDSEFELDLGVTDIRLYQKDHVTPNHVLISKLVNRFAKSKGIILGMGLTRPFATRNGQTPIHWLQINNIHFLEDPVWRME